MLSRATFEAIVALVKFGVWPWGDRDEVSWTELYDYQPSADDPNAHLNGAGVIMFWICQRLTYAEFWQLWALLGAMTAKRATSRVVQLSGFEKLNPGLLELVVKTFAGAAGELDDFVSSYTKNPPGMMRDIFEQSFRGATELLRGWFRVFDRIRQADRLAAQIADEPESDFLAQYMAQVEAMLAGVTELRKLEDAQ